MRKYYKVVVMIVLACGCCPWTAAQMVDESEAKHWDPKIGPEYLAELKAARDAALADMQQLVKAEEALRIFRQNNDRAYGLPSDLDELKQMKQAADAFADTELKDARAVYELMKKKYEATTSEQLDSALQRAVNPPQWTGTPVHYPDPANFLERDLKWTQEFLPRLQADFKEKQASTSEPPAAQNKPKQRSNLPKDRAKPPAGSFQDAGGGRAPLALVIWLVLVSANVLAGLTAGGPLLARKLPAVAKLAATLHRRAVPIGLFAIAAGVAAFAVSVVSVEILAGIVPQLTAVVAGVVLALELIESKVPDQVADWIADNEEKLDAVNARSGLIGIAALITGVAHLILGGALYVI